MKRDTSKNKSDESDKSNIHVYRLPSWTLHGEFFTTNQNSDDVENSLSKGHHRLVRVASEVDHSKRDALFSKASEMISLRQLRRKYFEDEIFGEPAWDILLILYLNDQIPLSITQVTKRVFYPPTTVLRWLDYLLRNDFVRRESHPHNNRMRMVELTDHGRRRLESYLSETLTLAP